MEWITLRLYICMVGESHSDTQRPVNVMTISAHDDVEGGLILIVMNNMAAAQQEEALSVRSRTPRPARTMDLSQTHHQPLYNQPHVFASTSTAPVNTSSAFVLLPIQMQVF